jgi:hypothetical protein
VRALLEREDTWAHVGKGSVNDLAARIAECLPGGPRGSAPSAGWAIARGLLEFAVSDLEPDWFQRVLFTRLDRLESGQATALDRVLFHVNA